MVNIALNVSYEIVMQEICIVVIRSIVDKSANILSCKNTIKEVIYEEFEDTKGVIRIRKSQDELHNGKKKKKRSKGQTTIHKTQHIKLQIG